MLSGTSTYSTLFTTSRPAKASNFASEIAEMPKTPPLKARRGHKQNLATRDSGVEGTVFYDVVPETLCQTVRQLIRQLHSKTSLSRRPLGSDIPYLRQVQIWQV